MSSFGYERVYLQLHKVADTPFNAQGSELKKLTVLLSQKNTIRDISITLF